MKTSYKCAVCGYYTLDRQGAYGICPVCFWEDDPGPYHEGGPNGISLEKAVENYKKYGAVRKDLSGYVRSPYAEEMNELKSGTAHLKRLIVDEINKLNNKNTKPVELIADRIINEILNKGSHGGLVFQIRQILAESEIRGLGSYRLAHKITHLNHNNDP